MLIIIINIFIYFCLSVLFTIFITVLFNFYLFMYSYPLIIYF